MVIKNLGLNSVKGLMHVKCPSGDVEQSEGQANNRHL